MSNETYVIMLDTGWGMAKFWRDKLTGPHCYGLPYVRNPLNAKKFKSREKCVEEAAKIKRHNDWIRHTCICRLRYDNGRP